MLLLSGFVLLVFHLQGVSAGLRVCRCNNTENILIGLTITGTVTNDTGDPVPGVIVRCEGRDVAVTDNNGQFSFDFRYSQRIVIRLVTTLPMVSVTRVIHIAEGYEGQVVLDTSLLTAQTSLVEDPDDFKLVIPVIGIQSAAGRKKRFANHYFEVSSQNGFMYMDGSAVTDRLTTYVAVWRTDQVNDARNAAGDFSTTGTTDGLYSAGMFCMEFRDTAGKTAILRDNFTVTTDLEDDVATLGNPSIWELDPDNGLWQLRTQLTGHSTLNAVVPIQPNGRDYNIDWRFDVCWMKVKVFQMEGYVGNMAGVNIYVNQDNMDGLWGFSIHAMTGDDGICVRVLCCKSRCDPNSFPLTSRVYANSVHASWIPDTVAPDGNAQLNYVTGLSFIESVTKPGVGPVLPSVQACAAYTGTPFRFHAQA